MNRKMIVNILSKMLLVESFVLLVPMIVSLIFHEKEYIYFLIVALGAAVVALLLGFIKPDNKTIYAKEGFTIVGLAWIMWALVGALPFRISGAIPSYVDCFFETVSGFTTTGSTILSEIESLPNGILFWRSMTHWIGGMGVLVFVMMITSLDKENSMHLMRAEVPGPEADKITPKATDTARILYFMYFILTALEVVFLMLGHMSFFDAVMHSFSTAGTGGFSNKNASIAYYNSAYIEGVITVFMALFGVNFNLYFLLRFKRFKEILCDEEFRAYIGIIAVATISIMFNIAGMCGGLLHAFRYSAFTVVSTITTTGFVSVNYEVWPTFSKVIILVIMIIGASAGSTGGGIKVSRFIILFKEIKKEATSIIHPNSVSVIKLSKKRVSDRTIKGVNIYFICYIFILFGSVLLVSLNNADFTTTFSAVLTTLNNVGPGLAKVGAIENFSFFSNFSKLVLSFDMLLGRLEIFPYLMLVSPYFWKRRF